MNKGFTLIETVIVMVIVIIIAATVIIRWNFDPMKLNSAVRKVAEDIRYAQKLAISTQTRCGIFFNNATTYTIFENSSTADPAPSTADPCSTAPDGADPDTANDFIVNFNDSRCSNYSGVAFTAMPTIYFNSLGTPVDATGTAIATQTVTVTYKTNKNITVETNTGRVSY